jgi:hypothetical protein
MVTMEVIVAQVATVARGLALVGETPTLQEAEILLVMAVMGEVGQAVVMEEPGLIREE